jgi:mono/diheme cytochrome c family protein
MEEVKKLTTQKISDHMMRAEKNFFARTTGFRVSLLIWAVVLGSLHAAATDFPPWEVPAEGSATVNPVKADKKVIETGAALYKMQCAACHGPAGKGDGVLPAANLTTEAFQSQSDGAIHYKLITGRGQMPSFKALPENDLWGVIHYLRSLAGPADTGPKKKGKLILSVSDQQGKKEVTAKLAELLEDGSEVPASEAKVGIYIKRYFGLLPVGGAIHYTDPQGVVKVTAPDDLPGGEKGTLEFIARIEDSSFEPGEAIQMAEWGTIVPPTNFFTERTLFKSNHITSWWVILSYTIVTIGIWIGILYVLLLIRQISKA